MKFNKKLSLLLFLLIFIIFLIVTTSKLFSNKTYQYSCDDNKSIKATYQNKKVYIKLSDDREFTLDQTISASGIKYSSKGGLVVFWSKGKASFFQENNSIIYSNCIEK